MDSTESGSEPALHASADAYAAGASRPLPRPGAPAARPQPVATISRAALDAVVVAVARGHRLSDTAVARLVAQVQAPHRDADLARLVDVLLEAELTPFQRSCLFDAAQRIAKSSNPFVSFRGCVQMRRIGMHDLRFENTAMLTLMLIASRSGAVLARRIEALID